MANESLTVPSGASPGDVAQRLERIEQTLDRLAGALDQALVTAPAAVATAVDTMDEFLLAAQARGIDIDALLRVAGNALGTMAETSTEAGGKAGLMALLRASRDPDVQRALDFVLRFMKRFGRGLAGEEPSHV